MSKNQPKAASPGAQDGEVKARVLTDCDLGKCNDVITIDAAELQALAGVVDADPAAVEYAESIAKE